jgi:hypothetical protein
VKNNGVYGVATGAANVAVLEDPGAVEEARWVRRYSGHAGSAGGRSSETQRVWRILHDGVGSQSLQVTGGCVRVDKYLKIEEPIFCLNLDDVLCLLGVVIARLVLEEPVAWVECCALALCKLVEPWSFAL